MRAGFRVQAQGARVSGPGPGRLGLGSRPGALGLRAQGPGIIFFAGTISNGIKKCTVWTCCLVPTPLGLATPHPHSTLPNTHTIWPPSATPLCPHRYLRLPALPALPACPPACRARMYSGECRCIAATSRAQARHRCGRGRGPGSAGTAGAGGPAAQAGGACGPHTHARVMGTGLWCGGGRQEARQS